MSGTKAGGKLAAVTNKERFGEDFYKRIGAKGGGNGRTGGFYGNHDLARIAGAKGGSNSKRGPWTAGQRANYEARKEASRNAL